MLILVILVALSWIGQRNTKLSLWLLIRTQFLYVMSGQTHTYYKLHYIYHPKHIYLATFITILPRRKHQKSQNKSTPQRKPHKMPMNNKFTRCYSLVNTHKTKDRVQENIVPEWLYAHASPHMRPSTMLQPTQHVPTCFVLFCHVKVIESTSKRRQRGQTFLPIPCSIARRPTPTDPLLISHCVTQK